MPDPPQAGNLVTMSQHLEHPPVGSAVLAQVRPSKVNAIRVLSKADAS